MARGWETAALLKLLAGCLFSILLSCAPALAERRVALVIGNSAYEFAPPLANPRNDAADMARKLEDLGFEVISGADLGLQDLRAKVREFVRLLEGADMALFFYAGHGLQVNGRNYVAPVDASLKSDDDLDFEAMPMELVLSAMERNTKTNLVFLDACRDNPLAVNLARSMGTRSGAVGRGLAKTEGGVGSLVAFATQPGNVALDGTGRNSPFTTALLKHLGTPGQGVTDDLILVRREVLEATGGKQVPWDNSSLTGKVVLVAKAETAAPAPRADNSVELAYWQTIKDANEKGFFEAYLEQYPDGAFANLARLKIAQIEAGVVAPRQTESEGDAAQIAYWNSVKDAGSLAYFEAYLARWPKGTFADIARIRIDEMKARQSLEQAARSAETMAAERVAADEAEKARLAAEEKARKEAQARAEADAKAAAEEKERRDAEAKAAAEREKQLQEQIARLEAARKALEAEQAKREAAAAEPEKEVAALDAKQEPAPDPGPPPLAGEDLARAVQVELNRLGCSVGRVDGKWGAGSSRALRQYAREAGVRLASTDPDTGLLDRLKATKARVCPLACGRGEVERNGRCEAAPREASVEPKAEPEAAPEPQTSSGRACWDCRITHLGSIDRVCSSDGTLPSNYRNSAAVQCTIVGKTSPRKAITPPKATLPASPPRRAEAGKECYVCQREGNDVSRKETICVRPGEALNSRTATAPTCRRL